MTDINSAIALQRGWQIINHHGKKWNLIGTQTIQENAPDFEHDARLYMALFEEMPNPNLYRNSDNLWVCVPDCPIQNEMVSKSDTIGTAICLAYAKWKGIEL
jgi:hypothetical protein